MLNLKTTFFSYTESEGMVARIDQNLDVTWWWRIHGSTLASGNNFNMFDILVTDTFLWRFSFAYTGSSTFKYIVNKFAKTNGDNVDESSWSNPLPS